MANDRECDCCGFKDPVGGLKEYPNDRNRGETKTMCHICANTLIGVHMMYPEQHDRDYVSLGKQMAWIGNQLRKDLAAGVLPKVS